VACIPKSMARFRISFKLSIQNSVFLQLAFIGFLIIVNFGVVQWFDSNLSEIEKTVDLVEKNSIYL
jgi:hypothetical protein